MIERIHNLIFVLAAMVVFSSSLSAAAPASAPLILSIDVVGNRVVEKETILARLESYVGQPLNRRAISRDVNHLYKSGDFSDVRVEGNRDSKDIHLIYRVKEYPLIGKVTLQGNAEVKTRDLKLRLKLKPGRVFNPKLRLADLNTIRKGYLKKGYYQVKVDFLEKPLDDGRVNIIINIDEGFITHIQRIRFIGNHMFSDSELRDAIASRQSDIASWISNRDIFERERFGADAQMLIQYYLERGYLDAKIESSNLAMSSDKKNFNLSFSINEGVQYTVSGIELQGDLVPGKEELLESVTLEEGRVYAQSRLVESIRALTEKVGDEGFAFATVTPLFQRSHDNNTVHITFDIEKGKKVYIDKILISGNEKTEDAVLRRQLKQFEGAQYAASQINRSKLNLTRSPMLEDVRVSLPKGRDTDKVDMKIDVTEKKTGSFTFGIGYSAVEKVIVSLKLAEENLFGKGYQAQVDGTVSFVTQNYTASFTDPYFLGKNMSASVNAFKSKADQLQSINYNQDSSGVGFGFGIPISDHLTYGVNYRYSTTNITKVPANASLIILSQQGKQTTGELSQVFTWDDRDRLTATSEGSVERIAFRVAGLGGQERFFETTVSASAYFPLDDENELVFNPSFEARDIRGLSGKDVPLQRRYSMGGSGSLRGFDYNGVSVRDLQTDDALGGDKMIRGSLNLLFPAPYIKTAGVRAAVFVDAGLPWGSVNGTFGNQVLNVREGFSLSRLRVSAGFGLEWISPVGPLTLIWGFPIRTVAGDLEKSFEFGLGGTF